jgi:hypothetical protein
MRSFERFLAGLLGEGRVVYEPELDPAEADSAAAVRVIRRAFEIQRLEVAGAAIELDVEVALAAGELVRRACWALVHRGEPPEELLERLTMRRPSRPSSPSHHLSADLTFRFLPGLHRQARAVDPADPMAVELGRLMRTWPLSGVLSDLDDGPDAPPDLGGHPGLMLLYAERLALRPRDAWRPSVRAAERVELVAFAIARASSR